MFIDKVKIYVKPGNGGSGAVSFHREKYVDNGGPDGGDGGKGGDIIFVTTKSKNTLNDFHFVKHFRAENGEKGDRKRCNGKQGKDLIILVPVGTVIKDAESGKIVIDLFEENQKHILLNGGRGGKGNTHFKNSRRQAPSFSQAGEITAEREIVLELLTIADVGLVGFPNAGKSTVLSVITSAKPKIANYHFTTLSPNLGVASYYDDTIVVADIPGLIEGASSGLGLGHTFLRHIERTRCLVHIVDMSGQEGKNPVEAFRSINSELEKYSKKLSKLPQIIVANKMDMPQSNENFKEFKQKVKKFKIIPMTAIIAEGIDELLREVFEMLKTLPALSPLEYEPFEFAVIDEESFEIISHGDGLYEVVGGLVTKLSRRVVFDDPESLNYFHRMLSDRGVIKELRKQGAIDGDTVVVGGLEFDFIE